MVPCRDENGTEEYTKEEMKAWSFFGDNAANAAVRKNYLSSSV